MRRLWESTLFLYLSVAIPVLVITGNPFTNRLKSVHTPVERQLDCFHYLAIMTNAFMNRIFAFSFFR
jgi:hypothetical protein